MMRHRNASPDPRRRSTPNFDALESRQMLNASPIAHPLLDASTIHQDRATAIRQESQVRAERTALRHLLRDLQHSMMHYQVVTHPATHQYSKKPATAGDAGTGTANHPDVIIKGLMPIEGGQPLGVGFSGTTYSPSQIQKAYGFNVAPNQGKGETVGIVDAYGDPNIVGDVAVFSGYFGLPQMDGVGSDPTLKVVSQPGNPGPPTAGDWDVETALDVEWVHSVAPLANIVLVEAASTSYTNLLGYGISTALANGAVVVSNSYGSTEFSGENSYDSTYLAPDSQSAVIDYSTGDTGAPGGFPAYSPNVVAVGGTSLYTVSAKGAYGTEVGWSGSGGGSSSYFGTPSYQSNNGVNYGSRSTPDVSMVADTNTDGWVYDSYYAPGYLIGVGGTSLACPVFSGAVAIADSARASNGFAPLVSNASNSDSIQAKLYTDYNSSNYTNDFHDITTGNNGHAAGPGYDQVTGIGSAKVQNLVITLSSKA